MLGFAYWFFLTHSWFLLLQSFLKNSFYLEMIWNFHFLLKWGLFILARYFWHIKQLDLLPFYIDQNIVFN